MSAHVSPGVPQIFRPKRRITRKERLVGGPEPSSLLQDPHRDSRSNNAGLTAADVRTRGDSGNAPPSASTAHLRIRVLSHSGTDFSNASNSGNPATASLSQLVSTQAFLFPFAETAPPPVTDPDADLASKTVCISGAVDVWPERGPVAGDPGIVPLRRLPGCTWRFHTRRFSASMLRCACSFRRI